MSMHDHSKLSFSGLLSGGISAMVSTTSLQPLDVIKTRVQEKAMQGNPRKKFLIGLVALEIVRTRGITGFWNGLSASLWRNVPGIAFYFATLNSAMKFVKEVYPRENDKYPLYLLGLVAASSRSIVAVTLFPFTFLKTRFESQKFSYSSLNAAFQSILKEDGAKVLFRGFLPTMARDIPFSALYFPIYSSTKDLNVHLFGIEHAKSNLGLFSAGCFSGAVASVITQPADVIKTHMQLNPSRFKTIAKTTKYIIMNDGVYGLFRGSTLRIARRTIITAVNWSIFERLAGEMLPLHKSNS